MTRETFSLNSLSFGVTLVRRELFLVRSRHRRVIIARMYRFFTTMWPGLIALLGLRVVFGALASSVVDLSYRGLKKEDFFVKIQPQITLHNTTDLILRGNEFDSFLDCSTKLDNLKKLDLSENHLQRFFFLCKEEYNLEILNVSHNNLEYIDDYALNDRVLRLKVLDLSSNKLTVVNETMLEPMKLLEFLSVANNPIVEIHEKAFWTLRALLHLDLSNVSANYFSPALFKPLTNLTYLNLSSNPIVTIPFLPISLQELDVSRTEIFYPENLLLPQLVSLHMNYMPNLTQLLLNDFENLTMLESLSAEGCKRLTEFRIWPPNSRILPRLQRLSVRDCSIESLNGDLRPIMQRTPVVDLQLNPWHCDCRMQWVNRLNLTSELSHEIRCSSPALHRGKVLADIPNVDLRCDEDSQIVYPLVWSALSILILALIAMIVFVLTKRPISQWKLPKRGGNTVSYKNVVESNNDLIRILNPGETSDRADE